MPYSRQSINILKTWFDSHKDNPYASPETKKLLAAQTKLSIQQVSLWLTNERKKIKKLNPVRTCEPLSTRNRSLLMKCFQHSNGSPSKEQIKELVNKTGLYEDRIALWMLKQKIK